ncbi:MAG TPA: LuxR C-terminal-related transcriptional regulator, partial [Pseudomonadales bacterium]|nr:LuxR C-terminal-related transcriptional regulator [Pseudomonadales bacterium]
LDNFHAAAPCCLILDIEMPALSGLELQQQLVARDRVPPIIFLTGHGTVPSAVQALKSGAVDFFQKPVTDGQALLNRVSQAIVQDAEAIVAHDRRKGAASLMAQLTPRELEVMKMICEGKANKVVAIDLGISERTVELHRGHLMRKLRVRSIPELIEINKALE